MSERSVTERAAGPVWALQIAPNDHPPFGEICLVYEKAFASLGLNTRTVILSPPVGTPAPAFSYLGLDDLGATRRGARVLRGAVGESPVLAVCHRYRAYRMLRSSGLEVPRVVAVAHEFGFFRRLRRRLERRLFARHVLFAGVSPAVQAELAGTVPEPLCLPNAVDVPGLDRERLSRQAALQRLGVAPSGALTLGLVGRLVPKKDPGLAVRALERLASRGVDVRLLVIGDGPLRSELERQARALPVTFTGFVPGARNLLSALDALLVTSGAAEAFGMVALEAMCAEVPVISPPVPGPQFVLGGSGYYYTDRTPEAIEQAVDQLLADRVSGALGERLARARSRALREFSVAALARHLDDVFFRGVGMQSPARERRHRASQ